MQGALPDVPKKRLGRARLFTGVYFSKQRSILENNVPHSSEEIMLYFMELYIPRGRMQLTRLSLQVMIRKWCYVNSRSIEKIVDIELRGFHYLGYPRARPANKGNKPVEKLVESVYNFLQTVLDLILMSNSACPCRKDIGRFCPFFPPVNDRRAAVHAKN
jgi:hypothetical protein